MIYELHITVEGESDKKIVTRFHDYCVNSQSCKSNLIALSSGVHSPQLMLAKKQVFPSDEVAIEWGTETSHALMAQGFKPIRIKVESHLVDGQAAYYEAHFKFHSRHPISIPGFLKSNNVLRSDVHYLSLRHYSHYSKEAQCARIKFELGRTVVSAILGYEGCHYERVIIDTNPEIDMGWIPEATFSVGERLVLS